MLHCVTIIRAHRYVKGILKNTDSERARSRKKVYNYNVYVKNENSLLPDAPKKDQQC